jgi:SAM-dependent methyltransferase
MTSQQDNDQSQATSSESNAQGILSSSSYLDVTYDVGRSPYGKYPFQLGQWLLKNIYKAPGTILDLGCGRGEHMAVFSDLGFEPSGVDISPKAPDLAGNRFDVKVANLEKDPLPFPDEQFDFLFSKSVIEHTKDPVTFLKKGFKALKPGGIAVIMVPSWEHSYWGPFYLDHTHITPFTQPSLKDAGVFAGFECLEVRFFYQLPFLWRWPFLFPVVKLIDLLSIPYRPMRQVKWPNRLNTLLRFSREAMLLAVMRKPDAN